MTTTIGIALVLGVIVFGISTYTAVETAKEKRQPIEWQYPIGFGIAMALLVILIGAVAA